MNECVFCEIVNNDPRGQILREYRNSVVFEPLNPVTPGHLLVVPKYHFADARDMPINAGIAFSRAAEEARKAGECNIITSCGRLATQTVFHMHIHIVPRRENDGLHLPWTGQNA